MFECILVAGIAMLHVEDYGKDGLTIDHPTYFNGFTVPIEGTEFTTNTDHETIRIEVITDKETIPVIISRHNPYTDPDILDESGWYNFRLVDVLRDCK